MIIEIVCIAVLVIAVAVMAIYLHRTLRGSARTASALRAETEVLRNAKESAERELAITKREMELLNERHREEREREQQQRKEQENMLKTQFENLANSIMKQHSKEFNDRNKESMEIILKPFRDNIFEFRKRVEDIYSSENQQRGELKNQLESLMQLNTSMTKEAQNLTQALRGQSKTQGDWGETILKTILESTLTRGVNYDLQFTATGADEDEEARIYRPDAIVYLPENKVIVIDSKVSLVDYMRYTVAENESEQRQALKDHIRSVKNHVNELSKKNYMDKVCRYLSQNGSQKVSPDFVIMFMPNEPAFLEALKEDMTIWTEAYRNKVMIASPTNLFAILKVVDNMWKSYDMDKKSKDIAECASALYERTRKFVEAFERVGDKLDSAQKEYNDAYDRLCKEKGAKSIIRIGESLRKLVPHIEERFPVRALEAADEDSEQNED